MTCEEGWLEQVHSGARWETFPVFMGIAVFAMEGIPTVLTIENSMAEPDRSGPSPDIQSPTRSSQMQYRAS